MVRCSIVIPVHGWVSLTRQCLDALLGGPQPRTAYEIVVVDDASPDATPAALAAYGDAIRVVRHASNTGFAAACNDGAAVATAADYLLFLNNDTVVTSGWLDTLVAYADAHPSAAMVGAKLLYPNGTVQHAGVVMCQDGYPRHVYAGFPAEHPAVNTARRFQMVTAACALVRRAIFENAGGFDTAFRNGYEDVDLCLRLCAAGHEIHYCPASVVYHLESVSRDTRTADYRHNDDLYRSRWYARVRPDDLDYYVADGLIGVEYRDYYPLRMQVSPQLAVAPLAAASVPDDLLALRAQQVFELTRENIRLHTRVREVELAREGPAARPPGAGAPAGAVGSRAPEDAGAAADAPLDPDDAAAVRRVFATMNAAYGRLERHGLLGARDHGVHDDARVDDVLRELRNSGLPLESFAWDGPADPSPEVVGWAIAAAYLGWPPDAVVLALLGEEGRTTALLADVRPAILYRHRAGTRTDLAGRTIGGAAQALEVPDAFADCIVADGGIADVEGDADAEPFREAARVLRPGGRIVVTPLSLSTVHENVVALGAPGLRIDAGAVAVPGRPGDGRFRRLYNVTALRRRVVELVADLRFHVVHVAGAFTGRPGAAAAHRFMLVGTRPS